MVDLIEFKRRSMLADIMPRLVAEDALIQMLGDFSVESILCALFGALDEPDLARIAREIGEYFEWKAAGLQSEARISLKTTARVQM